jgi:hypothetical protein
MLNIKSTVGAQVIEKSRAQRREFAIFPLRKVERSLDPKAVQGNLVELVSIDVLPDGIQ